MNDPNLVPEPVNALIEVFEAKLPDVEFPGVSAQSLRTQATTVDEAARAVADAEAALKEARSVHAEAFAALRTAAERGMGYARVYASDDEALSETLGAIELKPARSRRLPPKKRARKPKAKPDNVAELPLAAETA
ncbi:MAG: hypothetical protein ACE37F_36885 [Nannocystaceae bacterium]|nr:hypothetical protein [bacterium]